jgi:alpha-L-fucosidase
MGDSWSYVPGDKYKSTATLIHLLCKIVSMGGNFLLNVGPGPDGELDPIAYSRLMEIGQWMKVNSQAIHGSRPIDFDGETPLLFTKGSDGATYAILLQDEKMPALPNKISIPKNLITQNTQVSLLGTKNSLRSRIAPDGSLDVFFFFFARKKPPCQHAWVFQF